MRNIASNLWWTWNHRAKNLFYRIVPGRFAKLGTNPIALINSLSRKEIQTLEENEAFLSELAETTRLFDEYMHGPSWWESQDPQVAKMKVAYFSAEFGLHESIQIYSGGLGVLAGDFLKAASDLGMPVVGVGLLYHEGYFHQYLNADGWQQESYPQIETINIPIVPVMKPDGSRASISLRIDGRTVFVQAWQIEVGRVKLYLLDTNLDANEPQMRAITARLYGGDVHMRVRQEIVLGIGGLKMLKEIGLNPDLCHLNEGHSAFLAVEQLRTLVREKNLSWEDALVAVRTMNLFTTHTPVPAGNDVFHRDLITHYFTGFAEECGCDINTFLSLGRSNLPEGADWFSMTVFALRMSAAANAVSKLHSTVSRKLWQNLWPELPLEEIPIRHVTNGIHSATWTSRDIAELFDRYLGPDWTDQTFVPEMWSHIAQIPDEELWRILSRRRSILVTFCRERLVEQLSRRGVARMEVENARHVLDPDALTLGFARRFAAYKRANLLLKDLDRLVRLVSDRNRPVQFVFAGKAHPADQAGKQLIAEIIHVARRPELRGRFVFLEDYDMGVARKLLQGVDVWLNTPRRPLEASGTSGMKAAVNGVLNMSVLDGWWCEAYDRERPNGWSIGQGEEYPDPNYQDEVESRSLYDLLEREVIPMFYDRSYDDVPRAWVALVKQSVRTNAPQFSASRMVIEYAKRFYVPLGLGIQKVATTNYGAVKKVSADLNQFRQNWSKLKVLKVETEGMGHLAIRKNLPVTVTAQLGPFTPEDVAVEVYYGNLDSTYNIHQSSVTRLQKAQPESEAGVYSFTGAIKAERAGSYGFSVRIVPVVDGKPTAAIPGLITWWQ